MRIEIGIEMRIEMKLGINTQIRIHSKHRE